ncbi:MAG: nucleotidyltransferase family protein [Candidatus Omnitrophota bacterium]|nr:nucleotidyltransferase family protein [Candidatus Omnitrophota bacterium]
MSQDTLRLAAGRFICARKDVDEGLKAKAIALTKEGVDWKFFIDATMRGGVTVLVYETLRALDSSANIPRFVFDRLKSAYLYIISEVSLQHRELLELLKLFHERNIFAVPLKGTALAKQLYSDIAARGISGDIDILIKQKDKAKARMLLEEKGYSLISDSREERLGESVFIKPKNKTLDIHSYIMTKLDCNTERIEGFMGGVRLTEEEGCKYYEFKEEELLLYLAAHLVCSDCFRNLRYICDINALLYRYKNRINWGTLIKKAKVWKLAGSLYTVLKLSKDLFKSDVPLEGLRKIKPNLFKLVLIKIFTSKKVILRNNSRRSKTLLGIMGLTFYRLINSGSISDYLSVIFPPKEYLVHKSHTARIIKGILKLIRLAWLTE